MYAVIDIGSNTIRLVLYKLVGGIPQPALNSKQATGLAGYVDKRRRLTEEGIAKAIEVLRRFQRILATVQPKRTYVFATASLRNVVNGKEVAQAIRAACGLEVRILTGSEEAVFDYFGALHSLPAQDGLLVDIGGGSTELVLFRTSEVVSTCSLPMGSLDLFGRFVRDVLPTPEEFDAIARYAADQLASVTFPVPDAASDALCGVGGTCRAACLVSDALYDTHIGYTGFPCKRLKKMTKLLKTDRPALIRAIIKTAPDRLHTLLPGLAILTAVAARYDCVHFSASPCGVREGYLMYQLEGGHDHA